MEYGLLLSFLGVLIVNQCNAQAPDCFGQPDGILFENPQNPTDYYMCQGGIPIPMRCDTGKVFCKLVNACVTICPDPATTTTSTTTTTTTTPSTTTPTTTTSTSTTTPTTTTSTTTTTPTTTTTTTPSTTTTTTTQSPGVTPNPTMCTGYPNGVIFPLEGSCSGYVLCENGLPVVGYCKDNLQFNPLTGSCGKDQCN